MSTKMENVVRLEARHDGALEAAPVESPSHSVRRRGRRIWIVSAAALTIGAAGAFWITSPASSQTTDDAYISADSTTVAPKVAGLVSAVLVQDNASVRAGQPLVQIDPEEFDAKVRAAKADLAFVPPLAEVKRVRRWVRIEVGVFLLIPVFAALMARGYGL